MNYLSLNKLAVSNIRALLGSRRESIEALAGATKIPLSTLKRRLLNKSPFTLEEIEQIAKHFAVAASDLISPSIAIPALAEGGLRVKMCVWLGVSRGLDLAFLNAD
jgi:hypothetical protein